MKKSPPEYYAVFRGRVLQPAIFSSWADVHPRVTGYDDNLHKAFYSVNAARAWLHEQVGKGHVDKPLEVLIEGHGEAAVRQRNKNLYAVANGKQVGVYTDWSDCKPHVERVPGACHESFAMRADAEAFIEYWKETVAEIYMTEIKEALDKGLRPQTMKFDVEGLLWRNAAEKEPQTVKRETMDDLKLGKLSISE